MPKPNHPTLALAPAVNFSIPPITVALTNTCFPGRSFKDCDLNNLENLDINSDMNSRTCELKHMHTATGIRILRCKSPSVLCFIRRVTATNSLRFP